MKNNRWIILRLAVVRVVVEVNQIEPSVLIISWARINKIGRCVQAMERINHGVSATDLPAATFQIVIAEPQTGASRIMAEGLAVKEIVGVLTLLFVNLKHSKESVTFCRLGDF